MNNQEIVTKAIDKAVAGGWDARGYHLIIQAIVKAPEPVLYNHDFAKALWGDELAYLVEYRSPYQPEIVNSKIVAWQHHLQQMVIADDPIKYLGENI